MNYDSMTKAELVDKLKEQKHLSEAVQDKDRQISELQKQVKELKETIKYDKVDKERYDEVSNKLKDLVPKNLLEEAREQLKEFEGSIKKDKLDEIISRVEEERRYALETANMYKNSYEDLLRVFKVNLDMAITTNELLSERVNRGKKDN